MLSFTSVSQERKAESAVSTGSGCHWTVENWKNVVCCDEYLFLMKDTGGRPRVSGTNCVSRLVEVV